MKIFYCFNLIFFVLISSSFAITFEFVGPCSKIPILKLSHDFNQLQQLSVGDVTVDVLNRYEIDYIGGSESIVSILNTPYGGDAVEVFNNGDLRAHGWCYKVNGYAPEVYPHLYKVENRDHITWWFGYAQYKAGEWVTQCSPTYEIKPRLFCESFDI